MITAVLIFVPGRYGPLSRAELVSLLAERDQAVAERDRVITQLRAEAADLAARLELLERMVSRNSGNSSFPPSMDDQPGRKPPAGEPGRRQPARAELDCGSRKNQLVTPLLAGPDAGRGCDP